MTTGIRIVVAGALTCLLGVTAAPSASASGTAAVQTTNFAGYNATASSPITTFSGGINLPTVTCATTGNGSSFFAQTQIEDTSGNVAAFSVGGQCLPVNGGTPSAVTATVALFSNFSPSLDAQTSVGIAAGQTVNATVTENSGTRMTSVTIANPTTKTRGSASTPLVPSFTMVQAGLQQISFSGSGSFTPIPTFTSFKFVGLKFNGATLATLSPTELEMSDGSTLQVATSSIATNGTFRSIFKHV
jgi:hypothetical protein